MQSRRSPRARGCSAVFEKLRYEPEKTVAFAIAVIALSAKMAKADGHVSRDEVTAFREVFHISPADEAGAARVFNLARQDVTGFEEYARRIKSMYGEDTEPLTDLLEGLFHIAMADGLYHPNEDVFLHEVSRYFWPWGPVFFQVGARSLCLTQSVTPMMS